MTVAVGPEEGTGGHEVVEETCATGGTRLGKPCPAAFDAFQFDGEIVPLGIDRPAHVVFVLVLGGHRGKVSACLVACNRRN